MSDTSLEGHNLGRALLDAVHDAPVPPLACEGEALPRGEFAPRVALRQRIWSRGTPGRGERVLVATGRGNDVWLDMVALWSLGATVVPLEPHADARQLQAVLHTARPTFRIGDFDAHEEVEGLPPPLPGVSGPATADELPPSVSAVVPGHEAMVLFTSGSTGLPKGVPLTHGALLENAIATREVIGLGAGRRLFMPVPFRFISAISHFLVTVLCGSTLVGTENRLIPGSLVEALLDADADAFGGAPLQARWLAQSHESVRGKLRWLMSSGDHLPVDVIEDLRTHIPEMKIYTVYGLTELAGRFCVLPPDRLGSLAGSVGRGIPGFDVTVVGAHGQPAGAGEDGEVWAGGRCIFSGYLDLPEVNQRCLGPHGFNTGDIGHKDEDGWLYLTGRSDDVFKSGGLKVSTVEVSQALMETGLFADVAVVPWDATGVGLVPYAYVVMKPETPFQKGKVIRNLRERLPGHCIPKHYKQMEEIPRTGSGKVRRGVLKELLKTQ